MRTVETVRDLKTGSYPGNMSAENFATPLPRFLSSKDVRAALGVSADTAHKMMLNMEHVMIGRTLRVTQAAFDAFMAAHTRKPGT